MSTPSNRASNPAGKPAKRKDVTLDLTTARQMLPLVKGIVSDVQTNHSLRSRLATEKDLLEGSRLSLDWAGRQRRYAVADDLARAEKALDSAVAELSALGLKLADPAAGAIDFPTRINGRAAAFTWQPGDEGVAFWHYAGEDHRRPVPSDWQSGVALRPRAEP